MEKLHHDILIIMDEIDRICREYHLRYYLMCGSCLGAVRHSGFIPWDDDLDIAMPRSDFDRFIELVSDKKESNNNVLRESLYLRWITTEDVYNLPFAKLCLKGTLFQESEGRASQRAGIFVDIFPLDNCKPYGKSLEIKNRIVTLLYYGLYFKGSDHKQTKRNVKYWIIMLMSKLFSNRAIYNMMLSIIHPSNNIKYGYQAIFAAPYPIRKMVFPISWHGEVKERLFEGRSYYCPHESELYLEQIYGSDYMLLPPENKRRSHYPIRVIFRDGEEMFFEKVKTKVNYLDLLG